MAEKHSHKKKFAAVAAVAALTFAGAGVAFAYWTSSGTGTGTATTGESVAFTIASDPAEGTISPGGDGQTVDFTVTNPGPGVQYLSSVTVSLATAPGVPWVPTGSCLIADYTATISTAPVYGAIAAGGNLGGTATVTLANTALNQNDCQGQDVPLLFTAA